MFFLLYAVCAISFVLAVRLSYDIIVNAVQRDPEAGVVSRGPDGRPLLLAPGDMVGRGVCADSYRRRANPNYGGVLVYAGPSRDLRGAALVQD